jgi:hypothetical protein
MPRLPWTKKYKLLPSPKKWTIRTNVSFLFFDVFSMLALNKHAHWLKQIRKKKEEAEEENSFSESDDARFRRPSNDKKKKKNWCRHQTQEE